MQPDTVGGRYRLGRAIGRGGMGTVWLARDETLRRDVAVKQVGLLPGTSATDSARALREARSSAALSHRNVVTVFDVVEEHDAIWLVMEYVPGRSLAEVVAQDGPLEPGRVADIGAQVAEGLAAAHALGVVHRDVKPGNVLIREDDTAKISDFGIARSVGDPALTQSGLLTGTPSYFSPELARGAAPSPASDVWALGATLYTAVEGSPPYPPHDNPVAVLHDIASQQPLPPGRAGFLEPALVRMLDRNPDSRWSMADAAHALQRAARRHSPDQTRAVTLAQDGPWSATPPRQAAAAAGRGGGGGGRPGSPTPSGRGDSGRAGSQRPSPAPTPSARPDPPVRRTATTTGSTEPPRSHRLVRYVVLASVLALLVGGVAYLVSHQAKEPSAASSSSSSSSSRSPAKPSGSRSPRSSPSGSTPSGAASSSASSGSTSGSTVASPTATPSGDATPKAPAGGGTSAASFVRGYFAAAPGGTDEGWAQLGPGEQRQGRGSYDGFWRGIASVDVLDVRPVSGSDDVDVTLVYHRTSGSSSRERKRLHLIRSQDGGYLIDSESFVR